MHKAISKLAKNEILGALHERYQNTPKKEKTKILDEFVAVAGCHRKHGIRLLASVGTSPFKTPAVDRRTYDEAVREALVVVTKKLSQIARCTKMTKLVDLVVPNQPNFALNWTKLAKL